LSLIGKAKAPLRSVMASKFIAKTPIDPDTRSLIAEARRYI